MYALRPELVGGAVAPSFRGECTFAQTEADNSQRLEEAKQRHLEPFNLQPSAVYNHRYSEAVVHLSHARSRKVRDCDAVL
jgi:hypothetical protein